MNVGCPLRACRCGARYAPSQLEALRPVRTLDASEISEHAVGWPEHVVVDVRECAACRATIASLRQRPA